MARGKYREWLKEENLTLLKSWAIKGLTDRQIADSMGIAESTLYEWKKKYSEISEALKKGKEVFDAESVEALHQAGIGHYIEEVDTDITIRDGMEIKRIRKRKRWIPSNVTALIFWLKNRDPDNWKDRKAVEEVVNDDKAIMRYIELLDDELLGDEEENQ